MGELLLDEAVSSLYHGKTLYTIYKTADQTEQTKTQGSGVSGMPESQ